MARRVAAAWPAGDLGASIVGGAYTVSGGRSGAGAGLGFGLAGFSPASWPSIAARVALSDAGSRSIEPGRISRASGLRPPAVSISSREARSLSE
jgi:hypothetical protein